MAIRAGKKRDSSNWIKAMKKRETASDILERIILAYQTDKKKATKRHNYTIREFSKQESIDINGTEANTPMFAIDKENLSNFVGKNVDNRLVKANYVNFCNQIERTLGAPNLPMRIALKGYPKLRTSEQIKERLGKFRRREKFELKILREICPEIEVTQNRATKAAINILTWLYNNGKNRDQGEIAKELYEAIFDREKDKLFYVRRHKNQPMLHKCHDEAILERISHLTWVFINGSPFNKVRGVLGAISRLV